MTLLCQNSEFISVLLAGKKTMVFLPQISIAGSKTPEVPWPHFRWDAESLKIKSVLQN